jgi:hypothetical protein
MRSGTKRYFFRLFPDSRCENFPAKLFLVQEQSSAALRPPFFHSFAIIFNHRFYTNRPKSNVFCSTRQTNAKIVTVDRLQAVLNELILKIKEKNQWVVFEGSQMKDPEIMYCFSKGDNGFVQLQYPH